MRYNGHNLDDGVCDPLPRRALFRSRTSQKTRISIEHYEVDRGGHSYIYAPCHEQRFGRGAVAFHYKSVLISFDGACRRNGQPDAVASWAVFFSASSPHNEAHLLPDTATPTSQRAELTSGIKALKAVKRLIRPGEELEGIEQVVVKVDSEYLVRGATEWIHKWKSNGWTGSTGRLIVHRSLFQSLDDHIRDLEQEGIVVLFWLVPREQNQRADELANLALDNYESL
ncbi:ribonuclease H-like domain-containing protein [Phyllosticta capitalensis]